MSASISSIPSNPANVVPVVSAALANINLGESSMHALLYSIRNSVRNQLHCASSLKYAACIPAALFLAACSTISLDTPSSSPAPVVDAQNNADASQASALRTLTAEQDRLYRVDRTSKRLKY